ncbi:tol protein [Paraphaeosphaeria sporulosa]
MDKIHSCSSLTLIACVGSDPHHGLTGISLPRANIPCIRGYQLIPSQHDIKSSIWASRGWILQEALLSRRLLYFTDRQVVFESKNFVESELTDGSDIDFSSYFDCIFSFERFLTSRLGPLVFIKEYSTRKLARPESD